MALTARQRRGTKGGAKATTLSGDLNNSATSIACADLSTWSGATTNGPGTATISRGNSDIEVVSFTGISTNTLTGVTRGEAGTSAQSHSSGATVELTSTKIDFDEANELVAAMAANSCRVYKSTGATLTTAVLTALTFDTERFDTGALHSTSSNTGRLTAVTAGKYLITGSVEFAANATGYRQLGIRLNGTDQIANQLVPAVTGGAVTQLSVSTIWSLAAADYVELMAGQTSGGDLAVSAVTKFSPEFGMAFIGF